MPTEPRDEFKPNRTHFNEASMDAKADSFCHDAQRLNSADQPAKLAQVRCNEGLNSTTGCQPLNECITLG
jgi:hypothetical protein